jgi:hypothetical protein
MLKSHGVSFVFNCIVFYDSITTTTAFSALMKTWIFMNNLHTVVYPQIKSHQPRFCS